MAYLGLNALPQYNPANSPLQQGISTYQNLQRFPLTQNLTQAQTSLANQQATLAGLQAKYPLMFQGGVMGLIGSQQYLNDQSKNNSASSIQPQASSNNSSYQQAMQPVTQPNSLASIMGISGNQIANSMSPFVGSNAFGNAGVGGSVNNQEGPSAVNSASNMSIPNNIPSSSGQSPPTSSGVMPNGFDFNKMIQLSLLNQYGAGLTGAAGDAQSLARLALISGTNSPAYQQALARYNAQTQYYQSRAQPDIVKAQQALSNIQDQSSPQAQQLRNYISKQSSTPGNIQRATMAQAVSQGLAGIPVQAILNYAGVTGQSRLSDDRIKNVTGSIGLGQGPSDYYNQYQSFINNLPALKDQFTKFMGGSITPESMRELDPVFNPSTWESNPKVSLQTLQKLQDMFNSENQVFSKSASMDYNPIQISGLQDAENKLNGSQNQSPQVAAQQNFVHLQAPNGKVYNVPSNQVDQYIKLGGKRV